MRRQFSQCRLKNYDDCGQGCAWVLSGSYCRKRRWAKNPRKRSQCVGKDPPRCVLDSECKLTRKKFCRSKHTKRSHPRVTL